ncbi:hypothetical protein TI39_contig414g00007 [Zymoseptoria brevis]|uniref:NACHT domain-containing protein n=1 Tax=Zymoseptoria brevis TaxID=1047168 RepID=A0A0F4GLV3_9PEZI|nr:hypothetical protein TI39_contig414g00007 [Zymoseptoria brevis]
MATRPPRWHQAIARLSDKDKETLSPHSATTFDDLIQEIENQQEDLSIRDVLEKMSKWVKRFVKVGDTIVQYDTAHAALPWAGVRLILQVSMNNIDKHAAVLEGLEKITYLLAWSKIEEGNLSISYGAHDHLEKDFVPLYTHMLEFLARSIRFLRSKTKRLTAVLLSGDSKFAAHIKGMSDSKKATDSFTQQILSQTSHQQYDEVKKIVSQIADLERPIIRIEKRLDAQSEILDHQMKEEILKCSSAIPYWQHFQIVKPMPGTGHSGSGKSTLASILLRPLMSAHEQQSAPYPIYFFCSRNTAQPERAVPEQILRSLVRQASEPPGGALHSTLRARFESRRTAGEILGDEATEIIIETIKDRHMTYIVIDALDECDPQTRDVLIDALIEIPSRSTSLVKIFVTSRDTRTHITSRMNVYPAVAIDASRNQADVDLYVRRSVRTAIEKNKLLRTEKVDKDFEDKIVNSSAGRLERLPPALQQIYDDLYTLKMQEMGEEQGEVTRKILSWLLVAQKLLSTTELIELACAPDQPNMSTETVLDMCFDLVRLDRWQEDD